MNPEFESYTRALFGDEKYERFLQAFNEEPPVSLRLNPAKISADELPLISTANGEGNAAEPIPWCRNAYWLATRPNFTLDPLFHAGCYYVQEAGSMFLDTLLERYASSLSTSKGATALDLCAAPGGKSTLARTALPPSVTLYCNEPDRRRANILKENMLKWGQRNVVVTSNYAKDYARAKLSFDMIIADVPCSGEGMFRKDAGAIADWSVKKVLDCAALQRNIIEDIWPCLKPGGLLIYSTCTFNTRENEENISWISDTLGATLLEPPQRFIPGITRSEGLFMAALRKTSDDCVSAKPKPNALHILADTNNILPEEHHPAHAEALLADANPEPTGEKSSGKSTHAPYPRAELTHEQALAYLRREAITLPADAPTGYVIVTYLRHPLGFVKNLGSRANNLYPQEWRIRNK